MECKHSKTLSLVLCFLLLNHTAIKGEIPISESVNPQPQAICCGERERGGGDWKSPNNAWMNLCTHAHWHTINWVHTQWKYLYKLNYRVVHSFQQKVYTYTALTIDYTMLFLVTLCIRMLHSLWYIIMIMKTSIITIHYTIAPCYFVPRQFHTLSQHCKLKCTFSASNIARWAGGLEKARPQATSHTHTPLRTWCTYKKLSKISTIIACFQMVRLARPYVHCWYISGTLGMIYDCILIKGSGVHVFYLSWGYVYRSFDRAS